MFALDDPQRLAALARSGAIDPGCEDVFDRATRLAVRLLAVPVAVVSFCDDTRVAVRSGVGLDVGEPPPTASLCRRVVERQVPFVIADTRIHPSAAADEKLGERGVIAYCGMPISDGEYVLGVLCVVDHRPRRWSADELRVLDDLAAGIRAELALRRASSELDSAQRQTQAMVDAAHEALVAAVARSATERDRMQAELARSEERFRKTFDEAPIGIALVGLDGSWLRVNQSLCAILARSEAELVGHPFQDLTHPADLEADLGLMQGVLSGTCAGYRMDKRYVRADGEVVWADLSVALVSDDRGQPLHFVSQIQDITSRVQREHQNRMLARIVNDSEDAILAKDERGLITHWNRGAERLYGYAAAEAIGADVAMLMPPERADEHRTLLARALRGEAISGYETTRRHRDGHRFEVALTISPLRGLDGAPAGAAVIARDITTQAREQAARRQIEEQLRVTVEHAPIGVALIDLGDDARGRLVNVNRVFADLIGDPDPVGAGLTLHGPIHPDDVDVLQRDLTLLACDEQARIQVEVRCLHGDGRIGWLLLAGAAVPGEPGTRQAVIHAMDIGERKRFEGQLQYLADHDVLTGLFNRRRLEAELDHEVARAQRYGSQGAVIVIDLDGFKFVNDTMGHSRGDELVTRVGQLLRDVLRETDVVARIGGDEFAVIVGQADDAQGRIVAEKVLDTLRQGAVILSENRHARVTASIGVTTFDGDTALTAEELLVEADIAMYDAKELGRNRVQLYVRAEDRRGTLSLRQSWLERLRLGLEEERFELLAQPIRGICARGVERFELLLRLRGDDGELIPPGTFLHNAERFGLIGKIDRWVFGEALRLLARHHAAGHDIALSVNMSGKTLVDPELLEDLSQLVRDCPVPPDRLIVEVTETAAIVNIDRARGVARGLRQLGCRFALDDFGAGFASFYYLKHLEFDFLKIDGEFVKTLTTNTTDELVVKSVVDIARGLGAQTVAEFVGDDATVERLRELGVDYGQGFHLGRPAPLAELLPAFT